jgi:hypothetical protein
VAKKRKNEQTLEEFLAVLETTPPGDLRPELEGYAYRFTVLLPLLSSTGRAVFSGLQCALLFRLFMRRFRGFLASAHEGSPPWYGSWLPEGAQEPITDRHMLLVIYTAQRTEADQFFQHLKWVLQLEHVAGQDVVVIEKIPVWLVESRELPDLGA